MSKIIRIDVATTTIAVDPEFGNEIARFTFDDGGAPTYASVGAFPSREILVAHSTARTGFIPEALRAHRGKFADEPQIKQIVEKDEWVPLWVDNTLRAV